MQRKPRNKLFTKAFSRGWAGGSLNPGVYTEGGGASVIAGASLLSSTPLGKREKEPRGVFGGGLYVSPRFYLSYLEEAIHDFRVGGYKKGARLALKEYLRLRGVKC